MWIDRESEIDLLAYEPFAELVNDILLDEKMNPLTIGLFGSWGVGKSTLLKLIEDKIKKNDSKKDKIICVPLNAWIFEGYDDAKSALMESLLCTLKKEESVFSKFKDSIEKLIKKVNFFRLGAMAVKHGIPLATGTANPLGVMAYLISNKDTIKEDVKKVVKEDSTEDEESMINNIRSFREEFKKLLDEANIENLVVMIDDLDRCNPDRIIETLEAIKLFLSVPKTTFIIAIDDAVVKYSVKRKYPKIDEEDFGISENYIEKIIQLPIYIPELSQSDITNYLLLLIFELYFTKDTVKKLMGKLMDNNLFLEGEKISINTINEYIDDLSNNKYLIQDSYDDFEKIFTIVSKTSDVVSCMLKGNPRQAKRFLNTFLIRKKLGDIYYKCKENNIDYSILAKLVALEYIDKDLFRELYRWSIKNKNSDEITELRTITDIVNENKEIPDEFKKWNDIRILKWLKSDPKELYNKNLLQYFYLSRESLNINYSILDNLTIEERKIYNEIMRINRKVAYTKKIKELKGNNKVKSSKIILAIIDSFKENIKLIDKCQAIYLEYEEYRSDIRDVLKKITKVNATAPVCGVLNNMYREDKESFAEVINQLKANNVSDQQLSVITKEDSNVNRSGRI
ncbi:KAP family P-loop domain protein [Clostridium oceanicum]|uniref:KAP family P-loop domain protein n=2 Tax=Clostridium oceanicum TaxID=1543 RepID=A0ABN1JL95_9CLOT